MITLDESTLIAYVDGELDTQTIREVEAQLAEDDNARQYVEHLRALSSLARVAFNDVLHAPVPQHLKDAAQGKTLDAQDIPAPNPANEGAAPNVVSFQPKQTPGGARPWSQGFAAAAAVACLFLGIGGGYTYSEKSSNTAMQLAALSLQQDQSAMDQALNRALEVNVSGNALTWTNPDTGRSAAFTPVRTYQDKSGQFCREYRKDMTSGDATQSTFGLACRDDSGQWKTRYLILDGGAGENL